MNTLGTPILELEDVYKDFPSRGMGKKTTLRALTAINMKLYKGRSMAVVGESGSGKSTCAKILSLMYPPTQGKIKYRGEEFKGNQSRKNLMEYRSTVQMIFQDPFGSLNPTHTIFYHIARPLLLHKKVKSKKELPARVYELLETVGLTPVEETAKKYPHQLSGGQRQRVNIARNLAVGAQVVLADEPTSMLDVSIRMGVLNLMSDMKNDMGISFLYITHDIATARYFSDDLTVMYVGHMVEWGDVEEITQRPQHPYTKLLISAVPDPDKSIHEKLEGGEKGDIPNWSPESKGCPFATRCPDVMDKCRAQLPPITQLGDNHYTRCYLFEK